MGQLNTSVIINNLNFDVILQVEKEDKYWLESCHFANEDFTQLFLDYRLDDVVCDMLYKEVKQLMAAQQQEYEDELDTQQSLAYYW